MSWPDAQDQEVFSLKDEDLLDRFGPSGTIVYMPQCERLTHAQARTLVEHAVKEMSRVYRRAIADGLQLFVNNRRVDAFDPVRDAERTAQQVSLGMSRQNESACCSQNPFQSGAVSLPLRSGVRRSRSRSSSFLSMSGTTFHVRR